MNFPMSWLLSVDSGTSCVMSKHKLAIASIGRIVCTTSYSRLITAF